MSKYFLIDTLGRQFPEMNKQRTIGIVLQYVQMALSIGISLVYTPIMIRILGQSEYGIYSLSASIISYLSLLSLGFGSSYLRYYSRYKKDDKQEEIKKMNGLYILVFSIIGIVAFVVGIILASNAEIFYNSTYTQEEIKIAKILLLFLAINLAISFPASVFVSYITAQEKFIFQKILNMGKTIISPAVNIIFLYLGYGSIGMVISTTVISILIDIINIFYCFNKLKMKVSFKNPNFFLLKDIFGFSIFIALNQLVHQINWQTDKILLGKFCTGSVVAVYEIGSQINRLYTDLSTAVSSVFAPKVNMIVSRNQDNMDTELTNLMIKLGRVQTFIISLVLFGFIFFGKFFISIWVGSGFEKSYYVALLLMVPMFVPLIQNLGIEIQRAKNKHRFRSFVYTCMAIINLVISIILVQYWKEIGAAIGTSISLIVANGIIMNIYYHKVLKINIIKFWKSILSIFPSFILPIAFGILIMNFYSFRGIYDFLLLIVAFTLIYTISLYCFGLNKNEKNILIGLKNKIIKKV